MLKISSPAYSVILVLPVILFSIFSGDTLAQTIAWQKSFNQGDIFSSPRCQDLNNDGIKDIIIGAGVELDTSLNGILAMDGFNGSILWFRPVYDNLFTSAVFTDLNHDNKKDVIIGGRLANLLAIDGVNGNLLWEFHHCNDFLACKYDTLFNFYTPVIVPDVNSDGINDLVVTYGGFRLAAASDTNRPHGFLMLIDGATGDSLVALPTPDGKETYCSPTVADINNDGQKEIFFGTGGETIGGSLWMLELNDLIQNTPAFVKLVSAPKGFIAPVSLTDMNADTILDIVAISFNGTVYAIDGDDKSILHQIDFPGSESASQPCLGYFNHDSVPDVAVVLNEGVFPGYHASRKYLIDGATFQVFYSKPESTFSYFSLLAANTDSDATDELLVTVSYQDAAQTNHFSIYSLDPLTHDSVNYFHSASSFGMACTPTLNDVDHDGFFDLIFSHSSIVLQAQRQFYITRLKTSVSSAKAASWGEYLGTNKNSVLENRLFPGNHSFTEVAQQAGINQISVSRRTSYLHGGAAWFDYDNDGFVDLYITGGNIGDKLYHNDGYGSFTDVTVQAGLGSMVGKETNGAISGDIDNDGFRDLFVLTSKHMHNFLFKNNGNGTFSDISIPAGFIDTAESASASFGDYNRDGYIDLFVGNGIVNFVDTSPVPFFKTFPNNFYINNGNGTFTDIGPAMGVADTITSTLGVTFSDYDMDNDPDLVLANEFGRNHNNPNQLLRNNYPQNTFTDVSTQAGMNIHMDGMGVAKGDYDEDGDFDYYMTNIGRDVLMQNNGNGTFTNVINSSGLARDNSTLLLNGSPYIQVPKLTWGCGFFDYDNDTYLDLFTAAGNFLFAYTTLDTSKLFHSNGDGTFTDISAVAGVENLQQARGFAYADYDNDGDLDMVVCLQDTLVGNNHALLYRNNLPPSNWVKFNLVGVQSNRDAFGALVILKQGGRIFLREVDGGSSFASHHSSTVHFGLGNLVAQGGLIDSLIIRWPSGIIDSLGAIAANKTYIIREGGAITEWIPALPPGVAGISGNASACSGTVQTFSAVSAGATLFVWEFPPSWHVDSLGETATVTPDTTSGFVRVHGENQYGTGQTDSFYVTVMKTPSLTGEIMGDSAVCAGETATYIIVSSANADSLIWQYPASWVVINNGNSLYVQAFDTGGTIRAAAINGCGLSNEKILHVTVHDLPAKPEIIPGYHLGMCNGDTITLIASPEDSYQWNTGETTQTVFATDTGAFAVTVTSQYGCVNRSDTAHVYFLPAPLAPELALSNDTLFANTDTAAQYYWYRGSNLIDSGTVPFLVLTENGIYSVVVENAEGCMNASDALQVILDGIHLLGTATVQLFPNPVTDNLHIVFSSQTHAELTIHDITGKKLIAKSVESISCTISVEQLPEGIYYLRVKGNGYKNDFVAIPFVKMF